jgi:hypothetical protein
MQDELSRPPPEQTEESAIALQREHAAAAGAQLSDGERAAIERRMDTGTASKADHQAWDADLGTRVDLMISIVVAFKPA